MGMRTTLGQLRRLILREMKLGVAMASPPGEAFGDVDEPEFEPEPGGPTHIATVVPDYEPDEETKAAWRKGTWDAAASHAGEPWEPDEWIAHDAAKKAKAR